MIELIAMCAPDVAPQTIQEIIRIESSGNPLALHVNRLAGQKSAPQPPPAETPLQAARIALEYIEAGYTVDMGLMQINSTNLSWLGIELDALSTLFNPCANIAAGAAIFTESYERAARQFGKGQPALQAALSAYNTGNFSDGFSNGYVARYHGETPVGLPASIKISQQSASVLDAMKSPLSIHLTPPKNYTLRH